MDFTKLFELLTPLKDVVAVLSGLGLVTVLLAYLKHSAERKCWRDFKRQADDFAVRFVKADKRHPYQIDDDEWRAICERMLSDAHFSPMQIPELLDVSVIVTKEIIQDKVLNVNQT